MNTVLQPVATQVRVGDQIYPIAGRIARGFEPVLDAFIDNFARGEELGASACAMQAGHVLYDLWGGFTDGARTRAWDEHTIVCMMSVAKAAATTCAFVLVDEGRLDLDAPVARYWPEFAAAGKADLPVRYVLDHRAGLPVIDNLGRGTIYDWDAVVAALARQAPAWSPGEEAGYHILTMGFLVGELVRRVSGQSLGTFWRERIARPLAIDYQIGLHSTDNARCAEFRQAVEGTIFDAERTTPAAYVGRAWIQLDVGEDFNSAHWRGAEIPGANGHGNARAVARLYAMLVGGGELEGVRIMSPQTVARMRAEQHNLTEQVMGRSYHQALGILRNSPPIVWMGPNPNAFGHHGVGGAIGLGDPDAKLAFAYGMNQMHARFDNGPRAGSLIEATYRALGIPATRGELRNAGELRTA